MFEVSFLQLRNNKKYRKILNDKNLNVWKLASKTEKKKRNLEEEKFQDRRITDS